MATPPEYGEFPLRDFLGMAIDEAGEGRARASVEISDAHLNPNGVVHGAVLFALVDTGMGKATMSVLPEGQFCATVDIQIRFIRAASAGSLVADVEVLKRGRNLVHLDARVTDADGTLIATAAGTFAVVTP